MKNESRSTANRFPTKTAIRSIRTGAILLLLLLSLAQPAAMQAQDYSYTIDNGQVTITKYNGAGGAVTIPTTIDGLPVTRIGSEALQYNWDIISVTIPDSVSTIGDETSYGCSNLTKINIPKGVTTIGNLAFRDCFSLTGIVIGDNVANIGDHAFYSCSNLSNITIGKSAKTIVFSAFAQCSRLNSITIPDSVATLGDFAFYGCTALTNITIHNGVKTSGVGTFRGCTNLLRVTIPSSVTTIKNGAFLGCTLLKAAYFLGNAPGGGEPVFDQATVYYLSDTKGWPSAFAGQPCCGILRCKPTTPVSVCRRTNSASFSPEPAAWRWR